MHDLIVIGGGPAGLATAMAAHRAGMSVLVADVSQPPIDKPCGEGLMPDGLSALRRAGFELDEAPGFPFRGIRFIEDGVAVEAEFPNGLALGIRRTSLHGLMVEQCAAAGIDMRWGVRAEAGRGYAMIGGHPVPCGWIAGADGGNSAVRRFAGLERFARDARRYGFRRHFRLAPWSDFMELYWGPDCQVYVTPVAANELCVAVISENPRLRLDTALSRFPQLQAKLRHAEATDDERGAISAMRRLRHVHRGQIALVGDASGSVDAISGEGMSLAFQQAVALARCLSRGDLEAYEFEHRRIARRPAFMADVLLLTGARRELRRRALGALASRPYIFASMLAMHVGAVPALDVISNVLALGWGMLIA